MSNSTEKIDCYDFNGKAYDNNTRCSGQDYCCQTADQCRSDRLCTSNQSDNVFVRATCYDKPWSTQACATICLYHNSNGILPRVTICDDGSYCCDDDKTSCCANNEGLWLSDTGAILGRANQTSNPSATTTSSLPSSTATSSPTSDATDSSGLSKPAKLGVGVGVGVGGAAVLGLILLWFLWRRRKNNDGSNINNNSNIVPGQQYPYYPTQMSLAQTSPINSAPVSSTPAHTLTSVSLSHGAPTAFSELEDTTKGGSRRPAELES